MSTKTSASPIATLISQFSLQQKLFTNVFADIKNEHATKTMNENTNHLAWLAGHTVSTRFMIANVLGANTQEPFPHLFAQGKGLQKNETYPSLTELTKDWDSVSQKLSEKLNSLTESELNANAPFPTPCGTTVRDFLTFCAHHEAYTIGQVGIFRRFLGYPAMKYN